MEYYRLRYQEVVYTILKIKILESNIYEGELKSNCKSRDAITEKHMQWLEGQ